MADADKAYIGVRPCGCATFVMVAGYAPRGEEKAELKSQLADGGTVELTTVADARQRLTFGCDHGPVPLDEDEIDAAVEELLSEGRSDG